MKIRNLFIALVFIVATAISPKPSRASANTKVDLIEDISPGGNEPLDMAGPTGFGFINYNQDSKGNLLIKVSLKNAVPNIQYHGIFLVGGPTHSQATGYIDIGMLTTNKQGNGNATMIVPVETLQSLPFGSGQRTDHFDLMKSVGNPSAGSFTASGINYLVP